MEILGPDQKVWVMLGELSFLLLESTRALALVFPARECDCFLGVWKTQCVPGSDPIVPSQPQ